MNSRGILNIVSANPWSDDMNDECWTINTCRISGERSADGVEGWSRFASRSRPVRVKMQVEMTS